MEEPKHIYCDMRTGDPTSLPQPESKKTTGVVPHFQFQENPTAVSQNRRHQNTRQIVLVIAVVFFAILSAVFIGLYCTVENKVKSCGSKDSLASEENSTAVSTPVNRTNNDTKVLERYSLKFNGDSINDYAQTTGAPTMTAVTVSLLLKTTQSSDGHLVSYAVPERNNELLILFTANSIKVLLMQGKCQSVGAAISFTNIKINDGIWHNLFFVWRSKTGLYSLHKDGVPSGSRISPYTINKSLSGNGTWVLGQGQDSVGSGLDPKKTFQGELAELNIWDRVLSKAEITELIKGCKSTFTGNVKGWNDFLPGV